MLAGHALVCGQCGNLRSVCSDETRDWHVNESVCWPTASQQWGIRRLQEKHKAWRPEKNPDAVGPLDGVSVWVSDIDFTPEGGSDPFAFPVEESDGEHDEADGAGYEHDEEPGQWDQGAGGAVAEVEPGDDPAGYGDNEKP